MGTDPRRRLKTAIVSIVLILSTNGCHFIVSGILRDQYTVPIYHEKKSRHGYIQIDKIVNSRCGCSDVIAQKYNNRKIVYRFYYGCALFKTTKEVYTYCSRGELLVTEKYDGTADVETGSQTRLSPLDKFVLHKIDSFVKTETIDSSRYNLCKKEINGFKKMHGS
jgi:hypothetical protein